MHHLSSLSNSLNKCGSRYKLNHFFDRRVTCTNKWRWRRIGSTRKWFIFLLNARDIWISNRMLIKEQWGLSPFYRWPARFPHWSLPFVDLPTLLLLCSHKFPVLIQDRIDYIFSCWIMNYSSTQGTVHMAFDTYLGQVTRWFPCVTERERRISRHCKVLPFSRLQHRLLHFSFFPTLALSRFNIFFRRGSRWISTQ
jgi:hypothetical protein